MIVLDYIIANEDRHLNNFGALRNAETLQWLGMAPIYDSGSSLGYDKMPAQMRSEREVVCKPFKNHHAEQLKLVTDFSWIDFSALADVRSIIEKVLSDEKTVEYIDENRRRAIISGVERRIEKLRQFASVGSLQQADSTEDDVIKNVAENYVQKNQ